MVAAAGADRRHEVLRVLRRSPKPWTVTEIADELDVHPNTARLHVEALVASGQAARARSMPQGPGRPPASYQAVRVMDPGGARHYALLAQLLLQALGDDPSRDSEVLGAGRTWGRHEASTRPLVTRGATARHAIPELARLLEDVGFAPDEPVRGRRVRLRSCPFLELARSAPNVVCRLHLGMMRGALEQWGSPLTVERLVPFAEPDLCVAHLGRKPGLVA